MSPSASDDHDDLTARIRQDMLDLLAERAPNATACPSEVARSVRDDDWRELMPEVRSVAADLRDEGRVVVTQGGTPVDPQEATGPIRLGLAS